jgi:hypothetical protein
MRWFEKLEKKISFLAMPGLIYVVAMGKLLAVGFERQNGGGIINLLEFNPLLVLQGQWWRLFSFVFVPESTNLVSLLFEVYLLVLFARALEATWGSFRFTLYYVLGMLSQIIAGFVLLLVFSSNSSTGARFLHLTLVLAFARLFPDFMMYLFFIFPVKIKWLALFSVALIVLTVVQGGLPALVLAVFSLTNYFLFFGPGHWQELRQKKMVEEGQTIFQQAKQQVAAMPEKKCSVCGLTVETADVRLCTCPRCGEDGRFFCPEHLLAHLAGSRPAANITTPAPAQKRRLRSKRSK